MRFIFRTDASVQIGIGHVMRCLTLADSLRASGAECVFICREHKGNLIEGIRQRGYLVKRLPIDSNEIKYRDCIDISKSGYYTWLGSEWSVDADQTKLEFGESMIDWLIVDHYAIDVRWEQALRSKCRKLMVIDDLADRQHDCDLLLDQNLGRMKSDYCSLVPASCNVLVGSHYALLRPEFAKLRDYSLGRRTVSKIKKILISMGGIDQGNATGRILKALQGCSLPEDCEITVIMGSNAPWLKEVNFLVSQMNWPTKIKVNAQNMAVLMSNSDLAIGAAGSTSWERCCLGLPTLVFSLADNQIQIAKNLELAGVSIYIGSLSGNNLLKLRDKFSQLLSSPDQVSNLSKNAHSTVDGLGVERVCQTLISDQQ